MTGFCIWITGLPSSGKTTLAHAIAARIDHDYGRAATIIDGDTMRETISADLGFSRADRRTQVLRAATIARHVVEAGGIAIVALVSPYRAERDDCYQIIGAGRVVEVFTDCPPDVCASRDTKGLWAKARAGEITGFTGVDDPYEEPMGRVNVATRVLTAIESAHDGASRVASLCPPFRSNGNPALFIGRWSPIHNGHKAIIDRAAETGSVAIGVRCSADAYGVGDRVRMIRAAYPQADVSPVPDIGSINIGRNVGYEVVHYEVPDDVAAISATDIRAKIAAGDETWRDMVPAPVAAIMESIR